MTERPPNYIEVLDKLQNSKRFSPVRLEDVRQNIKAVLAGENPIGYEKWTKKDAEDALETLDKK
ncbi:hypothetical protein ACFLZH_06000 [Patescibacteria group bacterium]